MHGQILSDAEIVEIHNLMVEQWKAAGHAPDALRDPQRRGEFTINLARAIENAILQRVAPEMAHQEIN
ncbi:hypothetical protein [Hyphomicrobium sp. MC1]|uniref:hypothetical protein n=1 Tax=Hyphomicrobium sp. (strain MC1) TaxID=717785 RepID=UPI000213EACF|nr:hypothetical protein [Hyphomicrobium sp. MC1]CCB64070.1 protein of unknown function [Hyphomicrobium sp. MC1]